MTSEVTAPSIKEQEDLCIRLIDDKRLTLEYSAGVTYSIVEETYNLRHNNNIVLSITAHKYYGETHHEIKLFGVDVLGASGSRLFNHASKRHVHEFALLCSGHEDNHSDRITKAFHKALQLLDNENP
jgi:hypothetical protein